MPTTPPVPAYEISADLRRDAWGNSPNLAPTVDLKRDGIELPNDLPTASLKPAKANDPVCGPGTFLVNAGA